MKVSPKTYEPVVFFSDGLFKSLSYLFWEMFAKLNSLTPVLVSGSSGSAAVKPMGPKKVPSSSIFHYL